jgi:hypothetical protein
VPTTDEPNLGAARRTGGGSRITSTGSRNRPVPGEQAATRRGPQSRKPPGRGIQQAAQSRWRRPSPCQRGYRDQGRLLPAPAGFAPLRWREPRDFPLARLAVASARPRNDLMRGAAAGKYLNRAPRRLSYYRTRISEFGVRFPDGF